MMVLDINEEMHCIVVLFRIKYETFNNIYSTVMTVNDMIKQTKCGGIRTEASVDHSKLFILLWNELFFST